MINGTGKLMKDMDKTMPFLINVSNFRRRKLMGTDFKENNF